MFRSNHNIVCSFDKLSLGKAYSIFLYDFFDDSLRSRRRFLSDRSEKSPGILDTLVLWVKVPRVPVNK
jgi:hypothetical protein